MGVDWKWSILRSSGPELAQSGGARESERYAQVRGPPTPCYKSKPLQTISSMMYYTGRVSLQPCVTGGLSVTASAELADLPEHVCAHWA